MGGCAVWRRGIQGVYPPHKDGSPRGPCSGGPRIVGLSFWRHFRFNHPFKNHAKFNRVLDAILGAFCLPK